MMSVTYASIDELFGEGKFADAYAALTLGQRQLVSSDPALFELLTGELAVELGDLDKASSSADALLGRQLDIPGLNARAHRVLGRTCFCSGDVDNSLRHLNVARSICSRAGCETELAHVELTRLGLFLGIEPFENTLSMLAHVRRKVIRAAAPHLMAELRLCLARAEARHESALEAQKHLAAAADLLEAFPNLWLQGLLWLDKSNVEGLLGDLDSSFESARHAVHLAERSGHFRTRVAAAINISHILCWRGDFDAAKANVDYALRSAGANMHLRLAALDSWANLLISTGQYAECREVFDAILRIGAHRQGTRLHWDSLTELYSGARLAQAEGRWTEACAQLSLGIELSISCGDRLWTRRMQFARAKCLALLERCSDCASDIARATVSENLDLEGIAQYCGAVAAAESLNLDRARQHIARALRIADCMSNAALGHDVLLGMHSVVSEPHMAASVPPAPDLETAVALLELGGHTHILAREVAAVLDGTECTRALAVVATTPTGPRIVETRVWDDCEALAAARNTDPFDVIPLGRHRDEPWHVIVDPRPELEHRCTLIAIRKMIGTALTLDRYRRDEKQRAALWPAEALDGDPESIWASEQMAEVLGIARRIAPTPLSILLTGETGTGKEMLAHAIHRASDRPDRVFLPFNCSAVPRDMLESQLFGYRKGAFTGADTSFAGVIRSAAGGTVLLDEIADVSLDVQPKLLRFLETHEIHPLGEAQPIKVDVRIIAATNANLEQLVAAGRFREDLFYRLNVVRLRLPPLRERREEIPALVDHYLRRHGDEQKKGRLTLADETLEYLLLYSWPGNVRQLANEVRRMVALAEAGASLTPAMLSPEIQASRRTIPALAAVDPEVRVRIDQPLPAAVQLLEKTMVRSALDRSHGRVEEAAKLLGISRKGLFLKRRRWGLHPPS